MTLTQTEIESQPILWSQAIRLAEASHEELKPFFSGRVSFVGAGSSYYVGLAAAGYFSEVLGIDAQAVPASVYQPRRNETAVLISRSGTTTEAVEAAMVARRAGNPVVVVTTDADGPLTGHASKMVALEFVQERSVVQTGSATSSLMFLRTLADLLGGRPPRHDLPGEARRALADPFAITRAINHVVILGSGWRFGIACEAALKAQETALLWSERYVPLEYRHGPISCADDHTWVLILDPETGPITALAEDIRSVGAQVALATYDPLVELVRIQAFMVRLAIERGINPDRPRNLTRSVILRPA